MSVAVIVGVGPGLGSALCRRFASEGYAVAAIARTKAKVDAALTDIGTYNARGMGITADATVPAEVTRAMAAIQAELGTPDVVVYNAGAFEMASLLELTPERFEQLWRANCFGGFLWAQAAIPAMVERESGSVIFTGATGSVRGSARFAGLAVGKFGLRAVAQSAAREFGPKGVHVAHVIIDGMIDTPQVREWMPDRDPATLLDPDSIAETYWHLHQQPKTCWTHELDMRPSTETF